MSNSVRPHRWQPTRLLHPWDSPGKNTGMGCHFFLQWVKMKSESEVTQSYLTLRNPMDCSLPGSSVHGIFQARILEWVATSFSIWEMNIVLSPAVLPVEFTKCVLINGSMHETSLCSRNLGFPNILTMVFLFYCSNNNLYGITNKWCQSQWWRCTENSRKHLICWTY